MERLMALKEKVLAVWKLADLPGFFISMEMRMLRVACFIISTRIINDF